MEDRAEDVGPRDIQGLEQDTAEHAQKGDLVDGEEHFPDAQAQAGSGQLGVMAGDEEAGQGKADGDHEAVLRRRHELYIGKPRLPEQDEGAEAAQGADVRQHRGNDVGPAVQFVPERVGEKR